MLFSLPIYVGIAWYHRKRKVTVISGREFIWLFVFGIVGYYLASLFDFIGFTYLKASLERIILFIYPTIVVILSVIFLKVKISRQQLLAITLTYLGIVIAFGSELEINDKDLMTGAFFIIISAFTYASYIAGSGWLIPKLGVTVFTSYVMIISCICVIIHYAVVGNFDLWNYLPQVYFLGIAMAIISTVIPSFLVSLSIKKLGASNFAIIASFGPISTILLAYIFLGERINALQWIGTFLVISGVFFVSKSK